MYTFQLLLIKDTVFYEMVQRVLLISLNQISAFCSQYENASNEQFNMTE